MRQNSLVSGEMKPQNVGEELVGLSWACHLLLDAIFLLGSLDLVNDLIYFLIAHIADKGIDEEFDDLPLARYRRVDEYRLVAAFVR